MKWAPVESSVFRAAAMPRAKLCCTCCSAGERSIAISIFPGGSIKSFWRPIPKANTSGATFGDASVMSACADGGDDLALRRQILRKSHKKVLAYKT